MPPIPDQWEVDGRQPLRERNVLVDGQRVDRFTWTSTQNGFSVSASLFADDSLLVECFTGARGEPSFDMIGWRRLPRAEVREAVRHADACVRAFLLDGSRYHDSEAPS